ncbi:MAG: MFS transporter [Methanomassiliicoccales archaeon]
MALSSTSRQYIAFLTLTNLGFYVFQSYYIIYLRQSGLTFTDISVIFAANFVALALFCLVAGNFADRHGRKKAIVLGAVVNIAGFAIYGLSSSFWPFLAAEVILAGATALVNAGLEAWYMDELKCEGCISDVRVALPLTSGLSNVLGIAGGVVGSFLAAYTLNIPMLAGAAILIIPLIVAIGMFKENYGDRTGGFSSLIRSSMSHFRKSMALKALTAGEMLRGSAIIVYVIIYQPYLVAVGLGTDYLGIYFSLLMIAMAAGSLLSVKAAARFGRHRLLVLSSVLLVFAYLAQPLVHDYVLAGILFLITGFSQGLGLPSIMIWRNTLIPSRVRASTLAVLTVMLNLSAAVMSLGLGPLIDATSMEAAMYVGAILAAAAIPFYFVAHKWSLRVRDELQDMPPAGQAM